MFYKSPDLHSFNLLYSGPRNVAHCPFKKELHQHGSGGKENRRDQLECHPNEYTLFESLYCCPRNKKTLPRKLLWLS
jgi:hypothetical protein